MKKNVYIYIYVQLYIYAYNILNIGMSLLWTPWCMRHVQASKAAYAAILVDGRVATWGDTTLGEGNSRCTLALLFIFLYVSS